MNYSAGVGNNMKLIAKLKTTKKSEAVAAILSGGGKENEPLFRVSTEMKTVDVGNSAHSFVRNSSADLNR